MKKKGFSLSEMAAREGVTPEAVAWRLSHAKEDTPKFTKKCALPECDVVFTSSRKRRKYCSFLHSKRGGERTRVGRVAKMVVCRLPGCEQTFVSMRLKKCCSEKHIHTFGRREANGYYDKLVDRTPCLVCGFWGRVEEHHVVFRKNGGGDGKKNKVWLCPSHHQLIHANLARFENGVYVDLREQVRTAEIQKRKVWHER